MVGTSAGGEGGDATAIWFVQVLGAEIPLHSLLRGERAGVRALRRRADADQNRFGKHWLPHDARRRWAPAAIEEMAREQLTGEVGIAPAVNVEDRINAARMIFPRCYFDAGNCADGIDALSNYRRNGWTSSANCRPNLCTTGASHGDAFGENGAHGEGSAEAEGKRPAARVTAAGCGADGGQSAVGHARRRLFATARGRPREERARLRPTSCRKAESEELEVPTGDEAEEILKRARERYDDWLTRDKDNRDEAVKDKKFTFVPGEQWDKDTRENERKGRICLEINQLPQFVNQVVNDLRQNRAGIVVTPEGGGDDASVQEAQRRQDIIRGIEYECRADAIYDAGGADAVVGGRGWWRVLTKHKGDRSFDQVLTISPIADFTSVVADPDYQEPDGSDRCGAFVTETVSKPRSRAAWLGATAVDWSKAGEVDNHWFEGPRRSSSPTTTSGCAWCASS